MSFLVDAVLVGYEVRGVDRGTSKKGTEWRSIRVEDAAAGRTAEISCTDSALFPYVDNLSKGDICTFEVRAVAGRERSYLTLLKLPQVAGNAYRGDGE